jgi:hypothetical protein
MTGWNDPRNRSEGSAPATSPAGPIYRAARIAISQGFQTMLPGPYHFEDQWGIVGGSPYMPAPVVKFDSNFAGDVPLREAPTFVEAAPWRRKAPG